MNSLFANRSLPMLAVHAAGIVLLVWWIVLQVLPVHDTPAHFLFNFGYGSLAFAAGVVGFRRAAGWGGAHSAFGRALRQISCGALAFGTGLFIWTIYNFFGTAVPVLAFSDAAWLVGYVCFIRGLLGLTRTLPMRAVRGRMLAACAVSFGAVALAMMVSYPFLWNDQPLGMAMNVLYFGLAMVLLSLSLVALTLWGGKLGPFVLVLTVGFIDLAVANVAYLYRFGAGIYYNGDPTDLLFTVASYIIAAAVVGYLPSVRTASS